jgi:DNA repair photolyase
VPAKQTHYQALTFYTNLVFFTRKMEYITRKSLLYKSGLGFWCINHVQGCHHGCRYPCYAYMMALSHGRITDYSDWCQPRIVANAVELLIKDLGRIRVKPDEINLCLTTDPFMNGFPEISELSLHLIAIINSHGIPCSILTKGRLPVDLANRSLFTKDNQYGISLVSTNEDFRKLWEPGAAPYSERISALKALHEKSCQTYIHIEPYPTPNILNQNLEDLLKAVRFADRIFFSGWNYNKIVKQFPDAREFYHSQANLVSHFCREHGIEQV